jgi:hypothetical protein
LKSPALLFTLLLYAAWPAICQTAQLTPLESGYRQMYDLDFDGAHQSFRRWMQLHPDDAMGPASDSAAWLFAEFDRLHILQSELFAHDEAFLNHEKPTPDPGVKLRFQKSLDHARRLATAALTRDPHNPDAMLASAIDHGLEADYLGLIEKRYIPSLTAMKAGRLIAEDLIAHNPNMGDAYLAVGVENYTLSQKAALLRFFLRMGGAQTDYERGVRNVSFAAEHGHYLAPFARVLLAVAAVRDNNPARARAILQGLATEFPHNPLYAKELARIH